MARSVARTDQAEVGSDLEFERRWAKIQHWLWGVAVVVVAGGIAGLFGRGPLSTATIGSNADAAELQYERFGRFSTPAVMRLRVNENKLHAQDLKLLVSDDLADSIRFGQTSPPPASAQPTGGGVLLTFHLAGAGPTVIKFLQEPDRVGRVPGRLSVVGIRDFEFTQLVYP